VKHWTLCALIIGLVAFAGLGCDSDNESPNPTADVTINIVGDNGSNSYSPNPANVTAGQTVSWHNSDNMTHTATQDGGGFNTGNIASGATSAPITINTQGDLAYHCTIHPTMVATLHVTP
jgi:aldose sugar dehydrogenase